MVRQLLNLWSNLPHLNLAWCGCELDKWLQLEPFTRNQCTQIIDLRDHAKDLVVHLVMPPPPPQPYSPWLPPDFSSLPPGLIHVVYVYMYHGPRHCILTTNDTIWSWLESNSEITIIAVELLNTKRLLQACLMYIDIIIEGHYSTGLLEGSQICFVPQYNEASNTIRFLNLFIIKITHVIKQICLYSLVVWWTISGDSRVFQLLSLLLKTSINLGSQNRYDWVQRELMIVRYQHIVI